jgi:TolB protein
MGATGEAVRRISGKGYHPAWSPDGKRIVYTMRNVVRPEDSDAGGDETTGGLWIVTVADGSETRFLHGDATQPSWSPKGERIAYWIRAGDHSEIWTASVRDLDREHSPVLAFAEKATTWNPVWSPDGKYLYFPSDRAGSMNLWRIRVDQRTGKPQGEPQAITTPSAYSGQVVLSGDGSRLAYVQHLVSTNIARFEFDASRAGSLECRRILHRVSRVFSNRLFQATDVFWRSVTIPVHIVNSQ